MRVEIDDLEPEFDRNFFVPGIISNTCPGPTPPSRRIDEAAELARRYEDRGLPFDIMVPARQACAEGRRDDILAILTERQKAAPVRNNVNWLLYYLLGDKDAALAEARRFEAAETPYPLATFLVYRYFDLGPFPALMAALERERVQRPPQIEIPFACPPKDERSESSAMSGWTPTPAHHFAQMSTARQ